MLKPIRITVKGSDVGGEDAPTVEDLMAQILDFVGILKGVEDALADDGKREIVWRITDVTRNSPLSFEITPFPKTYGMNVDRRAAQVVASAAQGMQALTAGESRPAFFSDTLVEKVEHLHERVTNGLASTTVDFSDYPEAPTVEISKPTAARQISAIKAYRAPRAVPHKELGSVEGTISRVELDARERPVIWLKTRLDGQSVKCSANDDALARIGHYEVGEVLKGLRIMVFGLVTYKDLEDIASVDVEGVHVFADDSELPDIDKIVDPGFTKGVESSAFLEALRQNG